MADRSIANAHPEGDRNPTDGDFEARLPSRSRRRHALERVWLRGPDEPAYRALTGAWLVAALARLTLLEPAHGAGWWMASLLLVASAVGLVTWGGRLWWALGVLLVAWPYLLLRDWMTQSLILLLVAGVGCATAGADRRGDAVRRTARDLAVAGYVAAAFHKLNRGFLDAETSCAAYGWDKLVGFFDLGPELAANALVSGTHLAVAVVATELAVAVLLVARPRWGILLGLAFHVPLTLVLAPAFVFVMGLGYVAALGDAEWAALGARRWRGAAVVVAAATVAGGVIDGPMAAILAAKCAMLAIAFAAVLGLDVAGHGRSALPRHRLATAAVAVFALNAATPYVGVQFQHTAAMLSNLRIDAGCWNHLLVPESVRAVDPYLRIDTAAIGPSTARGPERPYASKEQVLMTTLWAPSAMQQIRRNWCRDHTRPIRISGTFRGEAFALEDLCDPAAALPRGVGLFGGREWFPNFLKLQKNLPRQCPAACVH